MKNRLANAIVFGTAILLFFASVAFGQKSNTNVGSAGERRDLTAAEIKAMQRGFGVAPDKIGVVGCSITDDSGAMVTEVTAAQPGMGETSYWLSYISNGVASSSVKFAVVPLFTGSPLGSQTQKFNLSPSSVTNIVTPFGIPYWGSNLTSGNWELIVVNDLNEAAVCPFTVVP